MSDCKLDPLNPHLKICDECKAEPGVLLLIDIGRNLCRECYRILYTSQQRYQRVLSLDK